MLRDRQIHDRFRLVDRHRVRVRTALLTDRHGLQATAPWVIVRHDPQAIGRMLTDHHGLQATAHTETGLRVPLVTVRLEIANHSVTDLTLHALPVNDLL